MQLKKFTSLVILIFISIHVHGQWLKKLESSDNLYAEAKKEIDNKHYQAAINLCNKGIDISPRNLDLHLLLGRAYSLSGKIDSARIELNHVIQKDPKYRDAYIYLVNMEAAICNYSQALEDVDQGLKYFPNDKDLLLKKLDIYNKEGDWVESNKIAEYLFDRYSEDRYIRNVYVDYKLNLAREYSHRGYLEIAKRAYSAVLEQDPMNKEALEAIYNIDVRSGNFESSLAFTNRALQSSPNSYEFLMKKVSMLESMGRYPEAIEVVQKLMREYPGSSEVQKLNIYIRMEAGRHYMNMDPYLQFQSVLEKEPSNREALNYVINISYSRGLLNDALHWTNVALKHYPNDQVLLNKKMGILEDLKNYTEASKLAEAEWKKNPTAENKVNFIELRTLAGRQYSAEQQYDSAIYALKSVLFYDHGNMQAINYLISVYSQQKAYDDALRTIDEALVIYPNEESLLFKKAGILEEYNHYSEAAQVSKELVQKYPENRKYLIAFVDQSIEAGRQSMQYNDYENTTILLKDVLDKQPDNVDALNYMINLESAFKQYDTALYYVNIALHYYPDSKDFLFKKASVYNDAKQYQEAYAISGQLYKEFPYNTRYRDAYIDQVLGSGRQYLANDRKDSALNEFYKALAASPRDTNALYYTIDLLSADMKYDTALALTARGRAMYPSNGFFLLKRANIYESMKRYNDASASADTLAKLNPADVKNNEYARYLYNKTLKNEIGLFFLHSTYDYQSEPSNIATLQYTRRYDRGSFTGRINYAARAQGTGFQFEGETYYLHTPRWYSYAVGAYSPVGSIVFPRVRLGYSLFHTFKKGWEGELGVRYLKSDSITVTQTPPGKIVSGVASIAKEINDFYFNLRGYYINLNDNTYYSGVLTSRYYLNNHSDYFAVIMGYGTAPDDFSLNYQLTGLLAYNTINVGAGYQKQINYRTTLGIFASWYNEKAKENLYHNQYDLYFQLLRRF